MNESPDFRIRCPPLLHLSYVQTENVVNKKLQPTHTTALNNTLSDVMKCRRFWSKISEEARGRGM